MRAFDEEDCRLLTKAHEYAWELFLKSKRLTTDNVHLAKDAIAYAVMEAAQRGNRNARRLARAAIDTVEQHLAALETQRAIPKAVKP